MDPERVQVVEGDISALEVDAVVNAANAHLAGGGGVDGAIHRRAGAELDAACRRIGGCPTGEARITPGFGLPARWIIHAVGPRWRGGHHNEAKQLAGCYRSALQLAVNYEVRTVAFPAISCGIYGYPVAAAADIAVHEVIQFLQRDATLERVLFCCFGSRVGAAYRQALTRYRAPQHSS